MGVGTEMCEIVARRGIALVAYFLAFLDLTILSYPKNSVRRKSHPIIFDVAIITSRPTSGSCVNETRRFQWSVLPLTTAEYSVLQLS
jgi:hypothetical protein